MPANPNTPTVPVYEFYKGGEPLVTLSFSDAAHVGDTLKIDDITYTVTKDRSTNAKGPYIVVRNI